jgi:LacI family transcriptional regulator
VIAYNDLMAIGLLQACRAAGVAVPERLSIVGFDDIFGSDFTTPAMTTIRSPLDRAGGAATRHLIAAVEGGPDEAPWDFSAEFVLRASTTTPMTSGPIQPAVPVRTDAP